MSTIRGRAVKVGGVATQPQGAEGRTTAAQITRPAFTIGPGPGQPMGGASGGGLLDLSTVGAWRLIAVGVAFAYVIGFHVSAGKIRLGIGPGR